MVNTNEIVVGALDGLLGERLRTVWQGNLRLLDWDKDFLAPFQRQCSEPGAYIGMGKTLSGLIHAARHFGGEADTLRARVVGDLLSTQAANGYLGLYAEAARTYRCWDVHEQAYLIQALVEDTAHCGNAEAFAGAERLGRWLLPRLADGRWREVGAGYVWSPLGIIGLDRALLRLSEATGDAVFADFCRDELGVPAWFDPVVEGRQGLVTGHAYAYLARCLAQLEMLGEGEPLPAATQAVIGYLRAGGGLVISGTCGKEECWHSDQSVDGKLGETCTTAYLIRWAAHLLRRTHDAWFGDLIERAMYNALFAANSADGRRIRYYAAGEGPRTWHKGDTYCCPGNYRRILGELAGAIAHPHGRGVAINLYEASRLSVTASDVAVDVVIETGYPFEGSVFLHLAPERPAAFPVYLRVPGWSDGMVVRCNGKALPVQAQRGWVTIERTWCEGDRLELSFAMPWRLVRGFRQQRHRVALMRGPVVWGADPACNEAHGEHLREVCPDVGTCRLQPNLRRATAQGTLSGKRVDLQLAPFAELDTATTYFVGTPGMQDERDHLLWLASEPIGTGEAPPA